MPDLALERVNQVSDSIGDVIFIHGLGGSSRETWTVKGVIKEGDAKQEYESFFPALLATDFPELDFWTLGYSASLTKWSENLEANELQRVCASILDYLLGKDIGKQSLILICHSLGGIVAKEILHLSKESKNRRQNSIYSSTCAVSFIATPHKGSKWGDIFSRINSILPFIRETTRLEELRFDSQYLENLSKWYRENIDLEQIETQSFYEQRKIKGLLIVPHISANPDVAGCDPIPISKNHISICKPTHKNSAVYVSIAGLIRYHLLEEYYLKRKGKNAKHILPEQTIVIGIVKEGDNVLMVRRRQMVNRLTWQFVAGRLKVGEEEPGECIVREIKEETGIIAKAEQELGTEIDANIPYKKLFYSCLYLGGKAKNKDKNENTDVKWVPIRDIEKHITTPLSETIRKHLCI